MVRGGGAMDRFLLVSLALAGCSQLVSKGDDSPCTSAEHECGTLPGGGVNCARNDSPATCGSRCDPCPAPEHAAATCSSGACGWNCQAGWHACGDRCASDLDPAACGAACISCPATTVAHAVTACVGGACGYACEAGFDPCAAGCCAAPVLTVTGPRTFAAGVRHTCGLSVAGWKCWGHNDRGQLGSGSSEASVLSPAPVTGAPAYRQVSGGYSHTCAVDLAGAVHRWGEWARTPTPVAGLSGEALQVAAGIGACCAVVAGGGVECFGAAPGAGVAPVEGISGALAVAMGWGFACAVTGPAQAACWGDNTHGKLGNPAAGASEPAPVAATNLSGATLLRALSLGQDHACAAYDAAGVQGAVRCWGGGPQGQLGGGTSPAESRTPVEVVDGALQPLASIVGLAAGSWHTCGVDSAGAVWCWGGGRSTAARVAGLAPALAVVAGEAHTCALVDLGGGAWEPWCWGANHLGQLGDGTRTSRDVPAAVPGF